MHGLLPRPLLPRPLLPRRGALLACLAATAMLAGCGGEEPLPPQVFAPLDFSYLTKLRLNVASIQIDDTWTPSVESGRHVEYLSPVQPIDALTRMGRERLVASGSGGQARFVIEDASILQQPGSLYGSFAVRLDVSSADGTRSGFAEARVVRSQPEVGDRSDGGRAAAYELTKRMMDDMNVEFEYQVRRTLRDYLQATQPTAPVPPPVQMQELPPPPGAALTPLPAPPGS